MSTIFRSNGHLLGWHGMLLDTIYVRSVILGSSKDLFYLFFLYNIFLKMWILWSIGEK